MSLEEELSKLMKELNMLNIAELNIAELNITQPSNNRLIEALKKRIEEIRERMKTLKK